VAVVSEDPDAEALRWGDETDPTHAAAPFETDAGAPGGTRASRSAGTTPDTGSFLLIGYGVFAGIYLLYTIGWFVAVLRNSLTLPGLVPEIMYQFGEFLAIVAPGVWLGAVVMLTRGRRPLARVLGLALGVLVLVPWPAIVGR
jgi:hypothetical protein